MAYVKALIVVFVVMASVGLLLQDWTTKFVFFGFWGCIWLLGCVLINRKGGL